MEEKLEWYLDWRNRGKPLEHKGKIYFLFSHIIFKDGKIMVSDTPIGPNNSKKEKPYDFKFVDPDECKIT